MDTPNITFEKFVRMQKKNMSYKNFLFHLRKHLNHILENYAAIKKQPISLHIKKVTY